MTTGEAMAHKPGSRKGQVHECFDAKGPEAAAALADKLGLAPGTARSWMNTWAKETNTPLPKAPKEGAGGKAPRQRQIVFDPTKRRVCDVTRPDVWGTVTEAGPEVSTVRWSEDVPWGRESYTQNKYLRDFTADDAARVAALVKEGIAEKEICELCDTVIRTKGTESCPLHACGDCGRMI